MLGSVITNEKSARAILAAIKSAGYEGIELNGFMIRKAPMLVRILTKASGMPTGKGGKLDWVSIIKESGLAVSAIHEDVRRIENQTYEVIQETTDFGTRNIVITGMYRFDYSDIRALDDLCNRLNKVGKVLKNAEVNLLYHNHNCELRMLSTGQTAFEYLIANTDPKYVNFEFDSYWPTEAGADALKMMEMLGSRMKLYHINDRGSRTTGQSITPILKSDSMELGFGNMDLVKLINKAKEVNVEAVILESHKNWVDKSPVASLKMSSDFMNKYVK